MNRTRSDSKARAASRAANYLNALSTPLEGEKNGQQSRSEEARRGLWIVHPKSLFVPLLWMRRCPSMELSEAVVSAAGVATDGAVVRSLSSMVHVHSEGRQDGMSVQNSEKYLKATKTLLTRNYVH